MREMSTRCKTLLIAVFIVILDQLTKYFVVSNLSLSDAISCCGILNIVYVENHGVAFGALKSLHEFVLFAVSLTILALYAWWCSKYQKSSGHHWSADGLIIGGAVGNLIDRICRGAVVDFLDFHWSGFHWPAFNIADSAVVLGIAVLLFWKDERK